MLFANHKGVKYPYRVHKGVIFNPERFTGLTAVVHFKEREGVLYASAQPGSTGVTMGDIPLGSVAIPVRGNDVVRAGSWTFSVDQPHGFVLDSMQRLPADAAVAIEVSSRGDCVAVTTSAVHPDVRKLVGACFVPTSTDPARDAIALATKAAQVAGLAVHPSDLAILGVGSSGRIAHAGPLIERVQASGQLQQGAEVLVTLNDRTTLRFRVL
ncbi:hypothetical protein [Propioniciclava sinopodophylli]|uniref:hypothetical protein n=1 Tax=Propioniciclava sinopodophylli TaxID=1837344 RepID=UPI002493B0DF|nr:hypothetical protein [Propioniciclava sinopodophylli]